MPTLREKAFADHVAFALSARDGEQLALYLSYQDTHAKNLITSLNVGWQELVKDLISSGREGDVDPGDAPARSLAVFKRSLASQGRNEAQGWTDILVFHILCIAYLNDRNEYGENAPDYDRAFAVQLQMCRTYSTMLRQAKTPTGWALPLIYTLCRELQSLAINADRDRYARGQKATRLEEASRMITSYFSLCVQDRGGEPEESRRMGAYYIACLLFKTYFKLRTLALCKNVRRGIDNTDLLPFDAFPMSHRVTYSYYLGVIAFFNEQYADAEEKLLFAFLNCHRKAERNRELVLTYLIPLRMMRGVMPSPLLLACFKRLGTVYAPFAKAFRAGNVRQYDEALQWAEKRLLESGTYLAVESAREGCLKGLLQRVWRYREPGPARTRIPVAAFQRALAVAGVVAEPAEVECILANMIYKGHMKGYISHERGMVVLSGKDAFPRLSATAPS